MAEVLGLEHHFNQNVWNKEGTFICTYDIEKETFKLKEVKFLKLGKSKKDETIEKNDKIMKKGLFLSTKRGGNAEQAGESLPGRQSDALSTLFMYASTVNVNLRLLTRKEIIKRGVLKLNLDPMLLKVQLEH
jgi:hypothetical protein